MYVSQLSVSFAQEGNTLGTTSEVEELTIDAEYQLPDSGPFFVLRTKGWSIDDPKDMAEAVAKAEAACVMLQESCRADEPCDAPKKKRRQRNV